MEKCAGEEDYGNSFHSKILNCEYNKKILPQKKKKNHSPQRTNEGKFESSQIT